MKQEEKEDAKTKREARTHKNEYSVWAVDKLGAEMRK